MHRSLRVLHVTPYCGEAWAYGGIPRVVATLTRGLARQGHRVTVCTTDVYDHKTRLTTRDRERAETKAGVIVKVFPNLSNSLAYHQQLFLPIGLVRYLRRHATDFDVAHIHAWRNVPAALASHYLGRAGVPYVLAPGGTASFLERRLLIKRAYDFVSGRRAMANASRVLAASEAEAQRLHGLAVNRATIRVMPIPLDVEEYVAKPDRGVFRTRYGLSNEPLVVFLGQLMTVKRLDVLIKAFARLPQRHARLVVAGNDRGAESRSRALVQSLGLADRTIFTGTLRGSERIGALVDADVVVYPSEHDAFGLVPLEAVLCGTPVVVSKGTGCSTIVESIGGGLTVPAGEVDALARSIDHVLTSPASWRAAAARASLFIAAEYGEGAVCARIENMYVEIVNAGLKGRSTGSRQVERYPEAGNAA